MDDQRDAKSPDETLTECEQKIEELQEENAHLRNAAETFGELAERLAAERRSLKGEPPLTGIAMDEKSPRRARGKT